MSYERNEITKEGVGVISFYRYFVRRGSADELPRDGQAGRCPASGRRRRATGRRKKRSNGRSPHPIRRPASCDVCHWWGEQGERKIHSDAATQRWICSWCSCLGTAPGYPSPGQYEIDGLGLRHVDTFTPCANCETGTTWVRYGSWALCLACANLGRPGQ